MVVGHHQEGRRTLRHLIEKEIHEKLVDEILFDQLKTGGKVKVKVKKGKLDIQFTPRR